MESKDSHLSASKAFFSLALAIFIINENSLLTLLYERLQIVLFLSGVILLVFSVIPLVEWGVNGFFVFFIDRKLSNFTINYWKTLNEPQWENLLNYILGNIYQELGLILILLNLIIEVSFFDQITFIFPLDYIRLLTMVSISFLVIVVITRTILRIKRNKLKLELSLYFLNTVTNTGRSPKNTKDYFLNENWILFQQEFQSFFETQVLKIRNSIKQIRYHILNQEKDNLYFNGILDQYNIIQNELKNTQINFITFLSIPYPDKLLNDTHKKVMKINNLCHFLFKEYQGNQPIRFAFKKEWSWSFLSDDQINKLHEIMENNGIVKVNGEDWKNNAYRNVDKALEYVEMILVELESFIVRFKSFD